MFEPRPFANRPSGQDALMDALQRRDMAAFELALNDPHVDPDYWYGKPYWTTCLQLAAKSEGCEPFVLALLRARAGSRMSRSSAPAPRRSVDADAAQRKTISQESSNLIYKYQTSAKPEARGETSCRRRWREKSEKYVEKRNSEDRGLRARGGSHRLRRRRGGEGRRQPRPAQYRQRRLARVGQRAGRAERAAGGGACAGHVAARGNQADAERGAHPGGARGPADGARGGDGARAAARQRPAGRHARPAAQPQIGAARQMYSFNSFFISRASKLRTIFLKIMKKRSRFQLHRQLHH